MTITQPNQSENSGLKSKHSSSKDADRADENKMLSEPFHNLFLDQVLSFTWFPVALNDTLM